MHLSNLRKKAYTEDSMSRMPPASKLLSVKIYTSRKEKAMAAYINIAADNYVQIIYVEPAMDYIKANYSRVL